MDFPEALWWMWSSKKAGLIPRVGMFVESVAINAQIISLVGFVNNEQEYDFLCTHCAVMATTSLNGTRHSSIGIRDPDFGTDLVFLWRKSARLTSEYNLGGMIERPILVRPGCSLDSEARFLSADPSNTLQFSGFGFYIPKLLI